MHEVNRMFESHKPESLWGVVFLSCIGILVGALVVLPLASLLAYINFIKGASVSIIEAVFPILMLTMFIGIPPWEFFHLKKIGSLSIFIGTYIGALICGVLWYVSFYT